MRRFTITLKSNKLFKGLVAAVFWVGVWQLISMAVAQELLVPAPAGFEHLVGLIKTLEFWKITGISLARIMLGFLSGIAPAVLPPLSPPDLRRPTALFPRFCGLCGYPVAPLPFWRWFGLTTTGCFGFHLLSDGGADCLEQS